MKYLLSCLVLFSTFSFTTAQTNYSLSFDGVDDYVSIGDNSDFDIQDAITISVKVKPNSIQTSSIIDRWAGYNTGYRLNLRGGPPEIIPGNPGAIWATFGVGDFSTSPNDTYSPNEWIEITGVWKNNNYIKLYINGLLIDETSTNKSFNIDQPLEFARLNYNGDDSEYLDGLMDDVAIWNFELSETQINDYVNSNVNIVEGLVGYWNKADWANLPTLDLRVPETVNSEGPHKQNPGLDYTDELLDKAIDLAGRYNKLSTSIIFPNASTSPHLIVSPRVYKLSALQEGAIPSIQI